MKMKKNILLLGALAALLTLSGCFGAKSTSMAGRGGEVVASVAEALLNLLLTEW